MKVVNEDIKNLIASKLHDCNVCSNRFKIGHRKRTYSVCLNINCKIEPTQGENPRRYFRSCRERFEIHLNNQETN